MPAPNSGEAYWPPRRVLTCGDRNWTDREMILRTLIQVDDSEGIAVVIHGAARGADTLAGIPGNLASTV